MKIKEKVNVFFKMIKLWFCWKIFLIMIVIDNIFNKNRSKC